MSERDDAVEPDDAEIPEGEQPVEVPEEGAEDGAEGDEDEKPEPKPVDWEKRAHSHAGQAARERSRRQAAERRATELESRLERLERQAGAGADELVETIASLRDDDDDPISDIGAVKRALRLQAQRQAEQQEAQQRQNHIERQVTLLRDTMADAEADYAVEHPDYKEAAAFYRQARHEELEEQGYSGDDLMRRLADDLFGLVRTAFSSGLDPAERVYNLAKKRGFKAGKGAADKKLDAFDRTASTGVRPQGRPQAGVLTWGDVAKLDGAAREKAFAKLREREMARK